MKVKNAGLFNAVATLSQQGAHNAPLVDWVCRPRNQRKLFFCHVNINTAVARTVFSRIIRYNRMRRTVTLGSYAFW